MSEMTEILIDKASRLFADHCTRKILDDAEQGIWPQRLWEALESTGLPLAATSEARGGPVSDLSDMLALVKTAAAFAAPVPLAETFLAERMLAAANLPVRTGPLTVGPVLRRDRVTLTRTGKDWKLSGRLHRIPWARDAHAIVVLAVYEASPRTVVIERPVVEEQGWSYAGEPRDTLRFDEYRVAESAVGDSGRGLSFDEVFFQGALIRAVAMTGALDRILELTVRYAKERIQFGRPIAKFQAVQQQIAVLASQVAASNAAAQAAIDAAAQGPACFEIAAAKARIGEAAGIAAGIAHQVHGAMGFTHEHSLHRSTRRLWDWRDEFGTETEWAAWVGRVVARVGGEGLWRFLTSLPKRSEHFVPA